MKGVIIFTLSNISRSIYAIDLPKPVYNVAPKRTGSEFWNSIVERMMDEFGCLEYTNFKELLTRFKKQ